MTTENTPSTDAARPTDEAAPRTRRRRAASAPATTVGAAAPAEATAAPAAASQAKAQAPADEAPKAPRRSRRSTKASGPAGTAPVNEAPAAEAPAAVAVAEPATAQPATAQPADAAPKRRSRRATVAAGAPATLDEAAAAPVTAERDAVVEQDVPAAAPARRSRRKAAPAVDATEAAAEAAAPAVTTESVTGATPEPAAPTTRSRRGRRATSPAAATAEAPAADTTADTTADEAPSRSAATLDVFAELGEPQEPRTRAPKLPSTALVFQAPDPERPRRRRAQAPAGPPKPLEDEAPEEETEAEALVADGTELTGGAEPTDEDVTTAGAEPEDTDEQDENDAEGEGARRRRRRRGGRGRRSRGGSDRTEAESDADQSEDSEPAGTDEDADGAEDEQGEGEDSEGGSTRRRRRRRRSGSGGGGQADEPAAPSSGRTRSRAGRTASDEVTALKGSTRLEAKRQRRREGRDAGRRRTVVTEAEFLARREAVERTMIVREQAGRVQIAVLEDDVLVEHFVSRSAQNAQSSMAGNVYLGRVQNVLPSMEAAFVDVGKGRNAVLYAGEVNWDAAGLEGQPRRIEQALKSGDSVLVQVTKDPIGHKGARLTSQITLAGRYLVYVPGGGMTGISRKLPENERARLKKLLKEIVPDAAGVIVRTAAEGASDEELRNDVQRLQDQWAAIEKKARTASAPALLQGEPDLAIRVVRDIFNDDFRSLVVQGDDAWSTISEYVGAMAPDLAERVSQWTGDGDVFAAHRIDEQLAKGMDRKVWLPSGGSLVIDRTEAMTVVDVNTGKFTGSGGTLEETVTRNNLEAAEEIVRQLRLRDIGGIIVIDFIDMVLESNRDLVLRRLVECLGRDRTKHQVAEVTSLGLVQMTRKRVGQGLVEAFSETCEHCNGRGFIVHTDPVEARGGDQPAAQGGGEQGSGESKRSRRGKKPTTAPVTVPVLPEAREAVKATLATIAAAAAHAHEHDHAHDEAHDGGPAVDGAPADDVVPADVAPDAPARDEVSEATPRATDEPAQSDGEVEAPAASAELEDAIGSIEAVEAPVAPLGDADQPSADDVAPEDSDRA